MAGPRAAADMPIHNADIAAIFNEIADPLKIDPGFGGAPWRRGFGLGPPGAGE